MRQACVGDIVFHKQGHGYWKFNNTLFNGKKYVKKIKNIIKETVDRPSVVKNNHDDDDKDNDMDVNHNYYKNNMDKKFVIKNFYA